MTRKRFIMRSFRPNISGRRAGVTQDLVSIACIVVLAISLLALASTSVAGAGGIAVSDNGAGCDYMSGAPIQLPAARLATNLFEPGVRVIVNRRHTVQPAAFDASGTLSRSVSFTTGVFPSYLVGNPYVSFLQEVRHYTNYCCTVTVDCPVTFYLLVDNRINDFGELSSLDDPTFGPPDTEWVSRDGWQRVNTGISQQVGGANRADYVSIFEGGIGIGAVDQFYAVYSKKLPAGGSIDLRTQFEGNIYCLVIATNNPGASVKAPAQKPAGSRPGG